MPLLAVPTRPPSSETPIEVEVLEIDGQSPPPAGTRQAEAGLRSWDETEGSTVGSPFTWHLPQLTHRGIHPFWWPLILIGGMIVVALVLTVGLAIFIAAVILRTLLRIIRALLS